MCFLHYARKAWDWKFCRLCLNQHWGTTQQTRLPCYWKQIASPLAGDSVKKDASLSWTPSISQLCDPGLQRLEGRSALPVRIEWKLALRLLILYQSLCLSDAGLPPEPLLCTSGYVHVQWDYLWELVIELVTKSVAFTVSLQAKEMSWPKWELFLGKSSQSLLNVAVLNYLCKACLGSSKRSFPCRTTQFSWLLTVKTIFPFV